MLQRLPAIWTDGAFLAVAGVYLYLSLFILPCTPTAGTDLDQAFYLHNASRMLTGQEIYRDFFQFTTPGSEFVYFLLFKAVGIHSWIPNITLLALGLGIVALALRLARQCLRGAIVCLPALLFLPFSFGSSLDASHHWFSMLLAIAATSAVVRRRTPSTLALSGSLCALASYFTQTRGVAVVAALAVFLTWELSSQPGNRPQMLKAQAALVGSFAAVSLVLNVPLAIEASLHRYLWSIVVFPLKYYPADAELNRFHLSMFKPLPWSIAPFLPDPGWMLVHSLLPLVYLIAFILVGTRGGSAVNSQIRLLILVGVFLFLTIASAPTALRMSVVALPGFILFCWCLQQLKRYPGVCYGVLVFAAVITMVCTTIQKQNTEYKIFTTPIGKAEFDDPSAYAQYKWIAENTHPGDAFFDCSGQSYFLLDLHSPAAVSFVTDTDYIRPNQVSDLIDQLQSHRVRFLAACGEFDKPAPSLDHLADFRSYLLEHYHSVPMNGAVNPILEQNPEPDRRLDQTR